MKIFRMTVTLIIGLSLFILARNARRRRIRQNVDTAPVGAAQQRRERQAEKHFDADAIDTLESEGGLVTSQ